MTEIVLNSDYEKKYGFHDEEKFTFKTQKGLSEEIVKQISHIKGEPEWMLDLRLKALKIFLSKELPRWGGDLSKINFDEFTYFLNPAEKTAHTWDDVPPDIKKTFDRLGIPEAEQKFLGGVGAQYECLSGDSLVFTNPKGPVAIKQIKEGDSVFSFNEQSNKLIVSKVKGLSYKGERQVYEVTVGTRKIKATLNHPFLSLSHYKKPGAIRGKYIREWKYLHELKVGDLIAITKDLPLVGKSIDLPPVVPSERDQKIVLPNKTSPDLMWFLGLYLGDGCIHREANKRKARVEIAIPEKDAQLQIELSKVVSTLFNYQIKKPDVWRLSINSTVLAEWIEKIGFKGNALMKSVPAWVFKLPKEELLAFLGGYVDADGYVGVPGKSSRHLSVTSANKQLLEDIRNICSYVGISSSHVNKFQSKHPHDISRIMIGYRLQLSGTFDKIQCRSVKRIERMNQRRHVHDFSSTENSTFRKHVTAELGFAKIARVERKGVEPVYDIEVDGPHNFVSEGIIVHNSQTVYHKLREDLAKQGVIFTDTDSALKEHPELFKKYFATVVPPGDNKFAALNTAVWSGGSFIYIPPGVKVKIPLQAYFRINAKNIGQFERTLIIVDKDAEVSYIEGCTAPSYSTDSLHAAVVEIIALEGAKVRYTTIQNWSNSVYNLVTKRAVAYKNAAVEWIDGNLGSKLTMKYPCIILKESGARADILSIAYAGKDQHQDAGGKAIHLASNTTSRIISKSVSKNGGRTSYRGLLRVVPGAENVISSVKCDALLLDEFSRSDTYPTMKIEDPSTTVAHEATVGKIGEEQLFYLMSRGLSESDAFSLIVLGFIAEFTKELPMEYAVELNRLIQLEMEGSVG